MRLIAKKPCSFGGRQFFVGDEIPTGLVADAKQQEKWGVVSIVATDGEASVEQTGALFTQEQVDSMVAEAVAELKQAEAGAYEGTVTISVFGESEGDNEQITVVPATPEEIQQVFTIMQMNADNGAKAITEVQNENVLILLHAVDSRKTIKDAAKKQADNLFSTPDGKNEA